jgi:hypothetical protein
MDMTRSMKITNTANILLILRTTAVWTHISKMMQLDDTDRVQLQTLTIFAPCMLGHLQRLWNYIRTEQELVMTICRDMHRIISLHHRLTNGTCRP